MKVFISWSGARSHAVAVELRRWLPRTLQSVEPFMSSSDLEKGGQWTSALSQELSETDYGVMCLTRENLAAPYLHFEAGALSKVVNRAHVSPLLIGDLVPTDVRPPLSLFQLTMPSLEDVSQLVLGMNSASERPLEPEVVHDSVRRWWPDLEQVLAKVGAEAPAEPAPPRSESDVLEEILTLLRTRSLADHPNARESKTGRQVRTLDLIARRLQAAGIPDGDYLVEVYDHDEALLHVPPQADEIGKALVKEAAGFGVRLIVGRFKPR